MPQQKFKFQNIKNKSQDSSVERGNDEETPVVSLVERIEAPREKMPFNFKFVQRSKITLNKDNNYPQSDIEKLANSILTYGLLHNLEGLYDEEVDTYILESGERRTRALDYLLEKYKNIKDSDPDYELFMENVKGYEKGYPMNVKRKKEDLPPDSQEAKLQELTSRIRLHAANQETRSEDQAEKLKNITEYKELLEARNRLLKRDERVNVNKTIAEFEGITERQVQRYNNIVKLIPELQEEFNKNNITLKEGDSYSKLSEDEQMILANLITQGKKVSAEELKKLKDAVEEKQEVIQAKQKEIEQLQTEKAEILQNQEIKLKEFKDSLKSQENEIREKIRAELNANNPDKQRIEELNAELKLIKQDGKQKIDAAIKQAEQKDQEIQKLQAELTEAKEKVDSQKLLEESELEKARMQAKVSIHLEQIKKSCENYLDLIQGNPGYKKEMVKLLKDFI